jgi:hypothetical protein
MSRREAAETKIKCICGCEEFIQIEDSRKQSTLI